MSLVNFSQLHQDNHFISHEGDWCIKTTVSKAVCMDGGSEKHKVGDIITFYGGEVVEPCPLRVRKDEANATDHLCGGV